MADRIPINLLETIEQTIPHRIAYFDSLNPDMYPIVLPEPAAATLLGGTLMLLFIRPRCGA